MWDILKQIDWSEGFYKGAFIVALAVMGFSFYHGVKFFGKRIIALFESLQASQKDLISLSGKMDKRIDLLEQRHEFTVKRVDRHDEQVDLLMESLLKATKR